MDLLDLFFGTDYSQEAIPERDPAFTLDAYATGPCEAFGGGAELTDDEFRLWLSMLAHWRGAAESRAAGPQQTRVA